MVQPERRVGTRDPRSRRTERLGFRARMAGAFLLGFLLTWGSVILASLAVPLDAMPFLDPSGWFHQVAVLTGLGSGPMGTGFGWIVAAAVVLTVEGTQGRGRTEVLWGVLSLVLGVLASYALFWRLLGLSPP